MLNISTEFKQALANDERNYQNRAVITLADGTVLRIDNAHIMYGGETIEDAVGSDNTFSALGAVIINSATLTLYNNDSIYSDYQFEDAEAVIYTGLVLSNGLEEIKKGTYVVDSASYGSSTITLNLLDNMSKFDRPYSESTLTFPTSMLNVVREACTKCGVTLASSSVSFPHSSFTISVAPDKEAVTFREVLSKCATIAGCFARCNVNGELELKWFDTDALSSGGSNVHSITNLYSQTIAVDDVTITEVRINVPVAIDDTTGTIIQTFTYGEPGYAIEISNNEFITTDNVYTILNWLGTQLVGVSFRPCNVTHTDDPSIEAGDVAKVTDTKSVEHPILITRVTFNPGRPQTIVCGAESPTRNNSTRLSESTKTFIENQRKFKKQKSEYEQAIEELSEKVDNAGGLFSTTVPQPGGGSIIYYHNKPNLSDSDIQLVISDVGVTVTANGTATTPTWYGLTVDGTLIASIMNTIGINFDWGVGGQLIIQDKQGNETFFADADTGEVRISADKVTIGSTDVASAISNVEGKVDNLNSWILDYTYELTNTTLTATATLSHNGEDVTQEYPSYMYRWYIRNESTDKEYVGYGYSIAVNRDLASYVGTLGLEWVELQNFDLVDDNNNFFVDNNGNTIIAFSEVY